MKTINLIVLSLFVLAKSYAQKIFYTTYDQNSAFLNVLDLETNLDNTKIATFPNDTIKTMILKNNIVYLSGNDSLYTLEYQNMDFPTSPIKKSMFAGRIASVTVTDNFVIIASYYETNYENYTIVNVDSIGNPENFKIKKNQYQAYELFPVGDSLVRLYLMVPGHPKEDDTYYLTKYLVNDITNNNDGFNNAPKYDFMFSEDLGYLQFSKIPFSFTMKNESLFYAILGKTRSWASGYTRSDGSEVARLYKINDKTELYSIDVPDNIGPLIKNIDNYFENNIIYSLSESNVLYKITDNEVEQTFSIDSLLTFKGQIISIKSDKNDDVYILKKDTICNLESSFVIKENISAFTVQNENALAIEKAESDLTLQIYPNPASDLVSLVFEYSDASYNIEIFNALGELVLKKEGITNLSKPLDLSNLSAGVYYLNILSLKGNQTKTTKFIKL